VVRKSRGRRTPSVVDAMGSGSRPGQLACGPVWRQVVDGLPSPIAVVDGDGVVVAANRAFRSKMRAAVVRGRVDGHGQEPSLATAVKLAVVGPGSTRLRALSCSGLVFDCCRLDDERALVALVGEGD
jgi:hypothetical protein